MIRTASTLLGTSLVLLCLAACGDSGASTTKVTPRKVDPNAQPAPGPDAAFDGGRARMGSATGITPPPARGGKPAGK